MRKRTQHIDSTACDVLIRTGTQSDGSPDKLMPVSGSTAAELLTESGD